MEYPQDYGDYTLLEAIGKGGMSHIDLAQTFITDAEYVRFLVIKRIQSKFIEDKSFIRMFQDEARIVSELQHANIAQVYSFGQHGDEYYMAMEYVAGVDLREVQRAVALQRKRIPLRISLRLIHDVLLALHYAHTRVDTFGDSMNIVHRDVNPRNIMISTRGEVKLIDFGVAKASTKLEQTIGHVLKGKYSYMSPEQIEGRPIDGRSDVFALGLVLYELLENRRPFIKQSEVQILRNIVKGNIPDLELPINHPNPQVIRDLKQKALEIRTENRYHSAEDMRQAVIEVARDVGGIASNQELSDFVRENLPVKIKSIENRLNVYRQETTQTLPSPEVASNSVVQTDDLTLSTISKLDITLETATEPVNKVKQSGKHPANEDSIESTFPNVKEFSLRESERSLNSSHMLLFVSICILCGALFWMYKQGEIQETASLQDEFDISDDVSKLKTTKNNFSSSSGTQTNEQNKDRRVNRTERNRNENSTDDIIEIKDGNIEKQALENRKTKSNEVQKRNKEHSSKDRSHNNSSTSDIDKGKLDNEVSQKIKESHETSSVDQDTEEISTEKMEDGTIEDKKSEDKKGEASEKRGINTDVETISGVDSQDEISQGEKQVGKSVFVFFVFEHDVEVFLDGSSLGTISKSKAMPLPEGEHLFVFVSAVTGNKQEKTIQLDKTRNNEIRLSSF